MKYIMMFFSLMCMGMAQEIVCKNDELPVGFFNAPKEIDHMKLEIDQLLRKMDHLKAKIDETVDHKELGDLERQLSELEKEITQFSEKTLESMEKTMESMEKIGEKLGYVRNLWRCVIAGGLASLILYFFYIKCFEAKLTADEIARRSAE